MCHIWHILSFPGVGYRIPRIPKWATCVRLCVTIICIDLGIFDIKEASWAKFDSNQVRAMNT